MDDSNGHLRGIDWTYMYAIYVRLVFYWPNITKDLFAIRYQLWIWVSNEIRYLRLSINLRVRVIYHRRGGINVKSNGASNEVFYTFKHAFALHRTREVIFVANSIKKKKCKKMENVELRKIEKCRKLNVELDLLIPDSWK